jgi:glycolate oxidase FAD binding subunit
MDKIGLGWRQVGPEDETLAFDGAMPGAVAYPSSLEEAAGLLGLASRAGAQVAIRGAGTKLGLGFPPGRVDLLLVTTRMNRIVEYEPANLTVTVDAGLSLAALQETLSSGGQWLALDPPYSDRATIGGILATNSSGPSRMAYGGARDLLIGSVVATSDGRISKSGGRVVKNVAGYDLNKLWIGSLGTLALIGEVTFKLAPLPAARGIVMASFDAVDSWSDAVGRIVRLPAPPQALAVLDANSAGELGLDVPASSPSNWLLVAMAAGSPAAVSRQLADIVGHCDSAGNAEVSPLDVGESWAAIREALAGRDENEPGLWLRASVPISRAGRVAEAFRKAIIERQETRIVRAYPALGDVQAFWPLAEDSPAEPIAREIAALRQLCEDAGGSLAIERAPSRVRIAANVWGDVGPHMRVIRSLKDRFDAPGILNAGRFVGQI